MTWIPSRGLRLWLRHPHRMLNFAFGCCPACYSSPPKPACSVCEGSYEYGPRLTPGLADKWRARFVTWIDAR